MDEKRFRQQIQRLEAVFNRQLPTGAFKVWWDTFRERRYEDTDFEYGVGKTILASSRFTSVSELDKYCHEARLSRLKSEHQRKRAEEKRYEGLTLQDILGRGSALSVYVRAWADNVKDLYSRRIGKEAWRRRHKEIEKAFKEGRPLMNGGCPKDRAGKDQNASLM